MNVDRRGHLNKYLPFSLVDGPGNRFVLFLQGCNFDCVVCHNPYTIDECSGCNICVDLCPDSALTLGTSPKPDVNHFACTDCDICIEVCPIDSTPLSSYVTVGDMLDKIRPTAPFLSGITVSGGEATLQPEFIRDLFAAIKNDPDLNHLTTLVDSNGSAAPAVWDMLAPVMDGAMIDLKALDADTHLRMTAQANGSVLASIRYLAGLDLLHEVRLLIAPGLNDSIETASKTADWLRTIDESLTLKIIGFRKNGTRPVASHIVEPDAEMLTDIANTYRAAGFSDVLII
ncbi:radical activating enzyme [hydrothermal vent metagenome]|uniref:Radical activating enzyme n=1 Tax=hydrothermal vent metagenome TaxID=652676 RepID=A0A3B0SJW0_9ZZZZ